MQNNQKTAWIVMWMTALAQAAMTLYIPALPAIASALHLGTTSAKSTITIFLLAYGFSQIFYGPLSDRSGRKPILFIGVGIFCAGCLINIFAETSSLFFAARFLQGLGCGSLIVIGRAVLRDSFNGQEFASVTSYLSMGFALGLGISPIIGGLLVKYISWRADFVALLLLGISMIFIIGRWLPETFNRDITQISNRQFLSQTTMGYKVIMGNPTFLKYLLGGVFAYSVVVAYNVMSPFLIQKILGHSAVVYGWLTILVALPYYFAASSNRYLVLKYGASSIFRIGIALIIFAGLIMAISCIDNNIYLMAVLIPVMIATYGQALVFPNAIAGALQSFSPTMGANVSAVLSSLQMMLTGVISAIIAIPSDNIYTFSIVLICLGVLSGLVLRKQLGLRKVHKTLVSPDHL